MIGNNDWFDYLDYREYIAHSWGVWDKKNVKYIDKIQTGSGKYRYIYPEDRKSNNERRRVPTYNDKYQREAERRQAQRQTDTNRRRSDAQVDTQRREAYNRQYRNKVDTERRQAGTLTSQNRSLNNQQIEADKQRRGYENQRRQAEQQMGLNRAASDRRLYDVQQQAKADSERRDMERKTAANSSQMEQRISDDRKPKNLFDRMGRAIGDAGNAISGAAKNVGNAVSGAAQNAGRAVSDTWNKATGGDGRLDLEDVTRGANKVGESVSGAARAAGEGARNLFDTAGNAISGLVPQSVGQWIDRNITGESAKKEMNENRAAWRDQTEKEKALLDLGYSKLRNNDVNGAITINNQLAQGNSSELYDKYNEASKDYANSLAGRIDKYITGDTSRKLADEYRQSANDAEERSRSYAQQYMMDLERDPSIRDFAKTKYTNDTPYYTDSSAYNAQVDADYDAERSKVYQNDADSSLFGRVGNIASNAAGAAQNVGRNLFDTAGNAIGGVRDYVSSLPQRAADASGLTARNNITEAAQREDAARVARDQARSNYEARANSNPELNLFAIQTGRNVTARQLQQAEAAGNEAVANQLRRQLQIYDDAIANPDKYARAIQNNVDPVSNYQQAYTDAAREHQLATMDTRAAQNAYDATPIGQIENLLGNIGVSVDEFEQWLRSKGR